MTITYKHEHKGRFEVRVQVNGRVYLKKFSCRHGVEKALKSAIDYEEEMKAKRNRPPRRYKILRRQKVDKPIIEEIDGRSYATCRYVGPGGRIKKSKFDVRYLGEEQAKKAAKNMAKKMASSFKDKGF